MTRNVRDRVGCLSILKVSRSKQRLIMKNDFDLVPTEIFAEADTESILERTATEGVAKGQSHVLIHTLNALIAEPDLTKFLDKLLVAITQELGGHSAALWIHDPKDKTNILHETSYGGEILTGQRQLDHPHAAKKGQFKRELTERVLTQGPVVIHDVANSSLIQPEVRRWMASQGLKSLLCVPLMVGKKVVGVLSIRRTSPKTFTAQEEALGQLLGHYVSLAVHLMRLAERGEEAAILEERTRIAQDIHDSLSQNLAAIVTQLELVKDTLRTTSSDETLSCLQLAQTLARESLVEARRSLWALLPATLEGRNLPGALRHLAAQLNERAITNVRFSVQGSPQQLTQEAEINLFRISQEAANNALRHADANSVQIRLSYDEDKVTLFVEDDGRRFDSAQGQASDGFGLMSLRERAKRAGGQATILSESGSGTQVVVEIPVGLSGPGGLTL